MITPTGFVIPEDQIAAFCERHKIRKLALFGSVLRDDFRPDSDIDVLVEFEPEVSLGLDFFTIKFEIEELLGREVDFIQFNSVNKYIRRRVLDFAQVIYCANSTLIPSVNLSNTDGQVSAHERDILRLRSMLDAAYEARTLLSEHPHEYGDSIFFHALMYNAEKIGEKAKYLSDEMRRKYPSLPLEDFIKIADKFHADYRGTHFDLILSITTKWLPELITQLEAILPPFVDEDIESNPDDV